MTVNPKSLENLNPATPGCAGRNPNGRPKGALSTKTILKKLLAAKMVDETTGEEMTAHELMLSRLLQGATAGDRKYIESVLDRVDGKPNQSIDIKEKTIDDLESLSENQLKERANAIIEKLNDNSDSGTRAD